MFINKKFLRFLFYPFISIFHIVFRIIIFWPSTSLGMWLRRKLYKQQLNHLGKNATFESGVRFGSPNKIYVGDSCILSRNVNINAGECLGIYIGNYVAIADGTYFRSANHAFDDLDIPIQQQGHNYKTVLYNGKKYSIVVEDDVWIGARAIILSGAKIGHGSVISAGAMVSSEIPPYSIVVGNPGRVIKNRLKN